MTILSVLVPKAYSSASPLTAAFVRSHRARDAYTVREEADRGQVLGSRRALHFVIRIKQRGSSTRLGERGMHCLWQRHVRTITIRLTWTGQRMGNTSKVGLCGQSFRRYGLMISNLEPGFEKVFVKSPTLPDLIEKRQVFGRISSQPFSSTSEVHGILCGSSCIRMRRLVFP